MDAKDSAGKAVAAEAPLRLHLEGPEKVEKVLLSHSLFHRIPSLSILPCYWCSYIPFFVDHVEQDLPEKALGTYGTTYSLTQPGEYQLSVRYSCSSVTTYTACSSPPHSEYSSHRREHGKPLDGKVFTVVALPKLSVSVAPGKTEETTSLTLSFTDGNGKPYDIAKERLGVTVEGPSGKVQRVWNNTCAYAESRTRVASVQNKHSSKIGRF